MKIYTAEELKDLERFIRVENSEISDNPEVIKKAVDRAIERCQNQIRVVSEHD